MDQDVFGEYPITDEIIYSKVRIGSTPRLIIAGIGIILLNSFIGFYVINRFGNQSDTTTQWTIAGGFSIIIFLIGLGGGKLWTYMGRKMAVLNFRPFLRQSEGQNWYTNLYVKFLEDDSRVYLEAQANDRNLKGPKALIGLIANLSLSQLGFFITILALLLRPSIESLRQLGPVYEDYEVLFTPILALIISFILLSLYLPMSIILKDANIRTFNTQTRLIDVPGSTFRGRLDAVVGISAISAGWSLFNEIRIKQGAIVFDGSANFLITLDYLAWLVYILVISWPLIFPAALMFFHGLEQSINDVRKYALESGIPVGMTNIRSLKTDEQFVLNSLNN